jgi:hypothetical protein
MRRAANDSAILSIALRSKFDVGIERKNSSFAIGGTVVKRIIWRRSPLDHGNDRVNIGTFVQPREESDELYVQTLRKR